MLRGTRIANAYAKVSVDGDGINEGIVEGFDKAGPDVDKAGDEHSQRYEEHFSEGFFSRLRRKFGSRMESEVGDKMARAGRAGGERMGESLTKTLLEKIDALGPETSDRIKKLMADVERSSKAAEAALARVENDPGHNETRFANLTHAARTAENAATRLERELRAVLRAEGLLDVAVSRNRNRGTEKGPGFGLTSLDDWLRNSRSRNNFLNVLYKSLGLLIHGFEAGFLVVNKFRDGMRAAGEEASFFQRIAGGFTGGGEAGAGLFGGIGKGLGGIITSGPGALAAIAAIAAGASVLVSILGGLVAIITALAATIATALTGALLVAGGAMAALAASAGLLVAAFTSLTDAQLKSLKSAFLPLKAEFTGLGQIMLRDLVPAFATWSKNLQNALGLAAPVAAVMGKAFAQAGNMFTSLLSGPGFQRFAQALTAYLPGIVKNLSEALGHFLNGMLSVFAALMPYVLQFAHWLEEVADRFAAWANSAKGQNAIESWMERAVASVKSLWNFLTSFTSFLFTVLFNPSAQNAGNTMFDSMARSFRRMSDAIARAQADGSLNRWFQDGVKFGSALWQTVQGLYKIFIALYNSGVLNAVGQLLGGLAKFMDAVSRATAPLIDKFGKFLPAAMGGTIAAIGAVANALSQLGGMIDWINGKSVSGNVYGPGKQDALGNLLGQGAGLSPSQVHNKLNSSPGFHIPKIDTSGLQNLGMNALNATSVDHGGFLPKPKKPKWKNPYVKWANSLIKDGPSVSAQIKNAMLSLNKSAANGIMDAAKSNDSGSVVNAMDSLMESLTTSGEQTVNTAQSALNSAAQSLAGATTKAAAKNALKKVRQSQRDLKAALDNQKRLQAAAGILASQKIVSEGNVDALTKGIFNINATLADYAEARVRIAKQLDDANQQLAAKIQLRDSYNQQVTESIKNFGALVTAQAKTIDGVQQALTAGDVTSNLQDRLDRIKAFQNDLRLLLAQGLSNDAYKQIVDAGVEQGTQIADALLAGGNGAIQNTNSLVDQINTIAGTLGTDTSNRLYQAGVDAAQGLVDGLTSLSQQLDTAAYNLGTSIAAAIQRALGIASPSRVLRSMMGYVGDGAVLGLDDQHVKVGAAAARFADKIAVNPTTGTYASTTAGVSGNGKPAAQVDLTIVTPTDDPHAVANEVINEVVGRL